MLNKRLCSFSLDPSDHPGVPNSILVKEEDPLAAKYKGKSVAEQNSVDLAWGILMDPQYKELRAVIYSNKDEFERFRSIVVNVVMATDIMDKVGPAAWKSLESAACSCSQAPAHPIPIPLNGSNLTGAWGSAPPTLGQGILRGSIQR